MKVYVVQVEIEHEERILFGVFGDKELAIDEYKLWYDKQDSEIQKHNHPEARDQIMLAYLDRVEPYVQGYGRERCTRNTSN